MGKNKPTFDGFGWDGKPTGHKCAICIHQDEECPHQGFFGEGAFLICNYDLEKCLKDGNN